MLLSGAEKGFFFGGGGGGEGEGRKSGQNDVMMVVVAGEERGRTETPMRTCTTVVPAMWSARPCRPTIPAAPRWVF